MWLERGPGASQEAVPLYAPQRFGHEWRPGLAVASRVNRGAVGCDVHRFLQKNISPCPCRHRCAWGQARLRLAVGDGPLNGGRPRFWGAGKHAG